MTTTNQPNNKSDANIIVASVSTGVDSAHSGPLSTVQLQKEGSAVYPVTTTQAIYDGHSGASLHAILHQFNDVYLPYQGSAYKTRIQLPMEMRRQGITISYVDLSGVSCKEQCIKTELLDDEHFGLDKYWSDVDKISQDGNYAVEMGDLAKSLADYAQAQGDYANAQGTYAKTEGDYAKEQGDYAKTQGDYAKTQGDYAKSSGETTDASRAAIEAHESERQSAESTRISNESTRISNENTRISNENARISAESARASAESTRISSESTRISNENARISAETSRASAESARVSAETAREQAFLSSKNACDASTTAANNATTAANTAANKANQASASANTEVENLTTLKNECSSMASAAQSAAQSAEEKIVQMESLMNDFSVESQSVPVRMVLSYPSEISTRNNLAQKISAVLYPTYGLQNVLFQREDGTSLRVNPSGDLTVKSTGTTTFYVIPTQNTSLWQEISISVRSPRMRLTSSGKIRLCGSKIRIV
jgi:hypothetical protein